MIVIALLGQSMSESGRILDLSKLVVELTVEHDKLSVRGIVHVTRTQVIQMTKLDGARQAGPIRVVHNESGR